MEKKYEILLRENEKLKNDLKNNRSKLTGGTGNYQAIVGSKLLGQLGQNTSASTAFGFNKNVNLSSVGGFGGIAQGTDRSAYQAKIMDTDKS